MAFTCTGAPGMQAHQASSIFVSPYLFVNEVLLKRKTERKKRKWTKLIRFAILPVFLLCFFYGIYALGNSALNAFTEKLLNNIAWAFEWLIQSIHLGKDAALVTGTAGHFSLAPQNKEQSFFRTGPCTGR